jgi:hypothetical protein
MDPTNAKASRRTVLYPSVRTLRPLFLTKQERPRMMLPNPKAPRVVGVGTPSSSRVGERSFVVNLMRRNICTA